MPRRLHIWRGHAGHAADSAHMIQILRTAGHVEIWVAQSGTCRTSAAVRSEGSLVVTKLPAIELVPHTVHSDVLKQRPTDVVAVVDGSGRAFIQEKDSELPLSSDPCSESLRASSQSSGRALAQEARRFRRKLLPRMTTIGASEAAELARRIQSLAVAFQESRSPGSPKRLAELRSPAIRTAGARRLGRSQIAPAARHAWLACEL